MSRSVWKGPFVDGYLLKKAAAVRESGRTNEVIKTWSRRSTILPQFVGLILVFTTDKSIFQFQCRKTWWGISLASSRPHGPITAMRLTRKRRGSNDG